MEQSSDAPKGLYGYRKFAACILALVAATALAYLGKIGDQVYATIVLATVGAYIAGNVAAKKASPEGNNAVGVDSTAAAKA